MIKRYTSTHTTSHLDTSLDIWCGILYICNHFHTHTHTHNLFSTFTTKYTVLLGRKRAHGRARTLPCVTTPADAEVHGMHCSRGVVVVH